MKKVFTTKTIVIYAMLTAIEIILQVVGNFIAIGPLAINLSLLPIAIGAILYGPICGLFLGLVNGAMALTAPSTIAIFMPINAWGTVLTCLIKSGVAGLLSGLIYLPFKKKHDVVGSILASVIVPIVNSGLFACFCLLFFQSFLKTGITDSYNMYTFLFLGVIGWNFIFELATSIVFVPIINRLIRYFKRNNELKER